MATTMRGPKPMKHGPRHTDECNEANDYSATERCICPPAPPLGATEGPWLLRYRGYQPDRRCIVTTSYEAEIADCGPALDLTAQANARLIAAAPTMLAALEDTANYQFDDGPCWCPRDNRPMPAHAACLNARAAIRAAKEGS